MLVMVFSPLKVVVSFVFVLCLVMEQTRGGTTNATRRGFVPRNSLKSTNLDMVT